MLSSFLDTVGMAVDKTVCASRKFYSGDIDRQ